MSTRDTKGCAVCRIVRTYLLIAVPLLAMVGFSSMSEGNATAAPWFARVELISFLASFAVIALVLIVAYRVHEEYWIPRKNKEKLESLVSQLKEEEDL